MNHLICSLAALLWLVGFVSGVRNLRIASPLQALTIWDADVETEKETHRSRFLSRFRAGLAAEATTRKRLAQQRQSRMQADATSADWARRAASSDRRTREQEESAVERAFDEAVQHFDSVEPMPTRHSENDYQFVGIVNSKASDTPITWYARKKPASAKWSLRLVHVNRQAIIKDLFGRGKVDIFGRYENTGRVNEETNQPIIASKYVVRERSWKNLWNFSLKHFFTDSSGMYWRERRVRPGLYTDGNTVYEASYRYRDGRNGMHRLSTFEKYLKSKAVNQAQKDRMLLRLKEDTPDIVLEG